MLLDILLSLIIIPNLWQNHFATDDFIFFNNKSQSINLTEPSPQRIYNNILDIQVTAKSALAIDSKTGKVLYQKNAEESLPIASITKLMTALVFLDHNPGWQKEFFTVAEDRRNGGIIHLNTGEVLTIRNLFFTALIASDNDAAIALARSTGLNEAEFAKEMNNKAQALGLNNTQFTEPTGLDNNNHSTAKDVIKLLNLALADEDIKKVTNLSSYEFEVRNKDKTRLVKLVNTDLLLKSYLNVIGGKTGSLTEVGYNLAVKIKDQEDHEIMIVTLGSQSNFDRFQDVKAIADWISTNYQWPGDDV